MLRTNDHSIKVKRKERPWSDVDNRVFFDHRLSLDTRLLLAWMLGRSDGFVIMVEPMRRWFDLSPKVWKRAKNELIAAGYYVQTRSKGADGKILWTHEVSDDPLDDVFLPWKPHSPSTIPPKRQDGETILPKGMDGGRTDAGSMDAHSRDNNKKEYESEKNNNNNSGQLVVVRFTDGTELGGVRSDWANELRIETEHRGPASKGKSAYAIGILKNWKQSGKPTLSRIQPAAPPVLSTPSTRIERCPPTSAFLQQAAKLKPGKKLSM